MKKDFFNGNIKHEFVSYMWTSIIVVAFIFFGCGGLFLYFYFNGNANASTSFFLLMLAIALFLIGFGWLLGTIFVIRNYPKYKKITRWFFNSDCYFVDSDSKEFRGHWRGKNAFDAVTQAAEQNKGLENIKYPKRYRTYIVLTIIGIVLTFVYLAVAYIVSENIDVLPKMLQSEYGVIAVFIIMEVVNFILLFVFAFRVKKIREITIKEYREKQYMRSDDLN